MIYGSVCSGIEAATVAWEPLGWRASFFSEIEKFPRDLLKHHYPDVPLHGDFTTIKEKDYEPIELLVGGTPCQDFSVAGLRKGLSGERGNLTLEFIRLAKRLRSKWLVWENVPGVLSIDKGRAFGAFLGGLAECGYGFAYRILDAQYFGVPQRRRRVFVIGYFGDWRPAAAVLFERESLLGDITPRRKKGKGIATTLDARSGKNGENTFNTSGGLVPVETFRFVSFGEYTATDTASTMKSRDNKDATDLIAMPIPINTQMALRGSETSNSSREGIGIGNEGDPSFTLQAAHSHAIAIPIHDKATRYKGGGDGRNNDGSSNGLGIGKDGGPMPTLDTGCNHAVAFQSYASSTQSMRWIGERIDRVDECL